MWPQGILGRRQWLIIDVFWPILYPTLHMPASGDSRNNQTASAHFSIMKPAKSCSTQPPISNVPQQPPSHNTAVLPKTDQIIQTDVSFSSYLKPDEPKGSSLDDPELNIFEAQKYFSECNDQILSSSKRVSPLRENISDPSMFPRYSSASSVDGFGRNYRSRSFRSCETPKASSEASWNSQTGLLSNSSGLRSVSGRDPSRKERKRGCTFPKWLLCRTKCPCSDKKSVQVVERSPKPTNPMRINNQDLKDVHLERQNENATGKTGMAGAVESKKSFLAANDHPCLHVMKKPVNYDSHPRFLIPNSLGKLSPRTENHFAKPEHGISRVTVSAPPKPLTDSVSEGFTFPVLSPSPSSPPPSKKLLLNGSSAPTNSSPPPNHPPRDSLEVFQPPGETRLSTKLREIYQIRCHQHLQAAAGLISSDNHSTRVPEIPKTETGIVSVNEDDGDGDSDASSDLFEIESFSTLSTSQIVHRRQRNSFSESKTAQIAT